MKMTRAYYIPSPHVSNCLGKLGVLFRQRLPFVMSLFSVLGVDKLFDLLSASISFLWASFLKLSIFTLNIIRKVPFLYEFLGYFATITNTIYFVLLKLFGNGVAAWTRFIQGSHYARDAKWSAINAHFPYFDWKFEAGSAKIWKRLNKNEVLTALQLARLAYEVPEIREYHTEEQGGFELQEYGFDDLLIYTVKQGETLYVVFKGTDPFGLNSIFKDVNCPLGSLQRTDFTIPGKMHQGFKEVIFGDHVQSWQKAELDYDNPLSYFTKTSFKKNITDKASFWNWFESAHKNDLNKYKIVITGHSLGGALSLIFASALHSKYPDLVQKEKLKVYAFAPPRVGDLKFSGWLHKELFGSAYKFTYQNEFATRVPFMTGDNPFDYAEAPGSLVFAQAGKLPVLSDSTPVKLDKIADIDFLQPHNLLNPYMWQYYRGETLLRRIERWISPFYIQDHFPSDILSSLSQS